MSGTLTTRVVVGAPLHGQIRPCKHLPERPLRAPKASEALLERPFRAPSGSQASLRRRIRAPIGSGVASSRVCEVPKVTSMPRQVVKKITEASVVVGTPLHGQKCPCRHACSSGQLKRAACPSGHVVHARICAHSAASCSYSSIYCACSTI